MYNVYIHMHTHTHTHTHTHIHTHTHKPVLLRNSGSGGYDCQFAMTGCKATHGSHPWNVDLHEMVANRQANAFVFRTLQLMRHTVTNLPEDQSTWCHIYVCFWIWGSAAPTYTGFCIWSYV